LVWLCGGINVCSRRRCHGSRWRWCADTPTNLTTFEGRQCNWLGDQAQVDVVPGFTKRYQLERREELLFCEHALGLLVRELPHQAKLTLR
jgi:hypothetical protein